MDLTRTILELIDMRSFSSLWYWIAVAVTWSSASHWVLGVPYDMVLRARRLGELEIRDLQDITRANINRIIYVTEEAGMMLIGIGSFFLTVLAILGFFYGVELCQAVFLLALPLTFVGLLSVRAARRIRATDSQGAMLMRDLSRHRIMVQLIGMIAIAVTALWGMLQLFNVSPIG
ncbi:MAG: component of SufBCD complex [Paracoccaceae bacterium]